MFIFHRNQQSSWQIAGNKYFKLNQNVLLRDSHLSLIVSINHRSKCIYLLCQYFPFQQQLVLVHTQGTILLGFGMLVCLLFLCSSIKWSFTKTNFISHMLYSSGSQTFHGDTVRITQEVFTYRFQLTSLRISDARGPRLGMVIAFLKSF